MTINVLKQDFGWGPFTPGNSITGAASLPTDGELFTHYQARSVQFGWCALGYTFTYPGVTDAQLGSGDWPTVGTHPGDDAIAYAEGINKGLDVALLGNDLGNGTLTIHLNGPGGGACFDSVIPFDLKIWGARQTIAAGDELLNSMALTLSKYYNNGGEAFLINYTISGGAVIDTSAAQDVGYTWPDLVAALSAGYGITIDPALDFWALVQGDFELAWNWSGIPAHDQNGGGGAYPFIPTAQNVFYIVANSQTVLMYQVTSGPPPPSGPNAISFTYPDGTLVNQWQYLNWSYPPFNTTIPFLNYSYAAPTKHFKRGK